MMTRVFRLIQVSILCCFFYSCQPTTQDMLNRGGAAFDAGRYQEAIDIYTKLLKAKPKIQTARFDRTLCYEALKNYPKAIADLNEIMKEQEHGPTMVYSDLVNPSASEEDRNQVYYFKALEERGMIYYDLGRLRDAFQDFQTCISNDYLVGPNYILQGDIYRISGKKEKACALYEKAKWLADPTADSLVSHYCNK